MSDNCRIDRCKFGLISACVIVLIAYAVDCPGQNLVPNGGFEAHGGLEYAIYDLNDLARTIKDWKACSPREPMYCHNEVVKKYGYAALFKRGYYKYDTSSVPEGRAMVKFDYVENCPEKDTGCTAYLQCKLMQPLMVGEVYEVSMWVRIEDNPGADTAVYSRIGMYLTKHRTASWPESNMLHAEYYFGGQLIPGKWQQIKWNIRALCALEYLTIGMFRDSTFHSLWRQVYNTVHYYVDDVRIVRLDEDSHSTDIKETPYCEYYKREHTDRVLESITELTVRYASATFDFSDRYAQALDSFFMANRMRRNRVFVVCGYTDDRPGENEQLALRRANCLKDYLCLRDSVNPETFLVYGFGSRSPIADNRSESGRRLNRRATIRTSDLTFDQLLYRKCLESLDADSIRNAYRYGMRWLRLTKHSNKVQMLVDPRLVKLKSTPYWGTFVKEVQRDYRGYADPGSAFFLDSMYFEDQRFRTYSPYALSGYIPEVDTVVLEAFKRREDIGIKHDSLNARLILAFMERKGFPRISVVGRRPCRGFYNILLHTADRTAFEVYLPVIENLCLEGECEWNVYALMADKVAVLNGEEQQYGTQYVYDDQGRLKMYRISSIEEVNARRRRIGLPPVTLLE